MILGIGVDMVEIHRVEQSLARFGDRFARKVLSAGELARFREANHPAAFLAKRFAAKEAVAKALGTGMRAGVHFVQITIDRKKSGAPRVELSGAARQRAEKLGAGTIHVSISDEADHAIAFAVMESSD